jgi:hypothetical protein
MKDLTLKITVKYNVRSESQSAEFDQNDLPWRKLPKLETSVPE